MAGKTSPALRMGLGIVLVVSLWAVAEARSGPVQPTRGCYITTLTCPLFPLNSGTFRDPLASSHWSPEHCLPRAFAHYLECGTTLPVTASFYEGGVMLESDTTQPLTSDMLRQTVVFQQEKVESIGDHVRGGYSVKNDAGTNDYKAIGLDGTEAGYLFGKMELSISQDPNSLKPPRTSPDPYQLVPFTGVRNGGPLPQPETHQATVDPGLPGATGVQAYETDTPGVREIGMSLHVRSCSVNWDYTKCPVVMTYRMPVGSSYHPFQGQDADQLQYTFDLKIPTVTGFGTGPDDVKGNVNVYLNFRDRHYPPGNFSVSYGAAAFHTDPGNTAPVGDDAQSQNWGVAVLLGNPSGSGAGSAYALQHNQSATYFTESNFSTYRRYRLVIDGATFRNLLAEINRRIAKSNNEPTDGGAPRPQKPYYSLNPADYQLDEIVMNPELYVPGVYRPDAGSPPPQALPDAHLALAFKNLKVTSHQSRDVKGAIQSVDHQPGTGTAIVSGWACAFSLEQSIQVALFHGNAGDVGGTLVTTATANLPSNTEVAYQCGTTNTPHGFSITLPASVLAQYSGKPLFVHGVSPVGLPDLPLKNSGVYRVPPGDLMIQRATVYRMLDPDTNLDRFYSLSDCPTGCFGYISEGGPFQLSLTSNDSTRAIYQCHWTVGGAHFLSTNSTCDGQTLDYALGHVFKRGVPGMRPLYRFRYSSGHSLSTTEYGDGAFNGLIFEEILGYVW
jgi:hypothetical protein